MTKVNVVGGKMSEVSLLEHNEIGYSKLVDTLRDNTCATVNHATGTGKSFIALKYLYNNRDKKYLYLAPTYHILTQLVKRDAKTLGIEDGELNLDTDIYISLLKMDMKELYEKYDGFILDEYHRAGAPETYKKLKELKEYIARDNKKKFIGLTATPIRYLDNERNMTEELFDGVVASKISLADAIIDGLLPTPYCICSLISCEEKYYKVRSKVNKMGASKEKSNYTKELSFVGSKITSKEAFYNLFRQHIPEQNGKYIVFCNTVDELNKYKRIADYWFPQSTGLKKYTVHSLQSIKKNQSELDSFNAVTSGMNLLFCIDILNEGIHVNGVDGVIMLRNTTSPRIYFQQMGRALSYSNRKKTIRVFDLVNNFSNHNAIYSVYLEVIQRLNERYTNDPKKREEVLAKFRIFDETSNVISRLDEINGEIDEQDLIRQTRIREAIGKFESYFSKNSPSSYIFSRRHLDPSLQTAYTTLSKYEKCVRNEEFSRLYNIPVLFPRTLSLSIQDREKRLGKFDTFEEKEKSEAKEQYNELISYIITERKLPEPESDMYKCFNLILLNGSLAERKKLKFLLKQNMVKLEPCEKVLLGEKITIDELRKVRDDAISIIESGKPLPSNLHTALDRVLGMLKDEKSVGIILNLIAKSDVIQENIEEQENAKRLESIDMLVKKYEECMDNNRDYKEILEELRNLQRNDRYIFQLKVNTNRKKKMADFLVGREKSVDITNVIKEFNTLGLNEFGELISMANSNSTMYLKISQVIEFIINNGKLPNRDTENDDEKRLAEYADEYYRDNRVSEEISKLKLNFQDGMSLFKTVLEEKLKESMGIATMIEVLSFVKENERKPLINSRDENEATLSRRLTVVSEQMTKDPRFVKMLKLINADRYLVRTVREYASNQEKMDTIGGK